jgi:hypothetical protein
MDKYLQRSTITPPGQFRARVRLLVEVSAIAVVKERNGCPLEFIDLIDIEDVHDVVEILDFIESV